MKLECTDCGRTGTTMDPVRRVPPCSVPLCLRCFRKREAKLIKEWNQWFKAAQATRQNPTA